MKKGILTGLILLSLVSFSSCNKDDSNGNGILSVRLTDSPAAYEEVLIDVAEVQINVSGDENGWQTLEGVNTGVYNLLDLTNGMDTLLVEQPLPAGTISQMRLILGQNNKVKVDGVYHDLATPSAQQSGLKFNIHATLLEGLTYKLWIDFDAGRSIVNKGNGTYSLKPVIRTFTEATSGAIEGIISPVSSECYIQAISTNNDTFSTYANKETGYFLLQALDAGTYEIEIEPIDGFIEKDIEDVEVTTGNKTNMGTITIDQVSN
jgi:hypothetical protein